MNNPRAFAPALACAAALTALTGCTYLQPTPSIPDARLDLPSRVTLRVGESTAAPIDFQRYLHSGEAPQSYSLRVSGFSEGVRYNLNKSRLTENDRALLLLEAARNAPEGRHTLFVFVTDEQGRALSDSLEVWVKRPQVQPAPVREVPLQGTPINVQPAPVQPAPLP